MKHFVSEIFVELEQWGLRGDTLLWKYLKNYYAAIELPYPVEHLKEDILRIFKDFTGELPVREKYYFVKEFSKNCNWIKQRQNRTAFNKIIRFRKNERVVKIQS